MPPLKLPFLSKEKTGGEWVTETLLAWKIPAIFVVPGSQTIPITHFLPSSYPLFTARSERSALLIGGGMGYYLRYPSAVVVTLGPGVALTPPYLPFLVKEKIPLLLLTPGQPEKKIPRIREVFQGLSGEQFLSDIVPFLFRVKERDELPFGVESALTTLLKDPPSPVFLEISFPLLFQGGFSAPIPSFSPEIFPRKESSYLLYGGDPPSSIPSSAEVTLGNLPEESILPFAVGIFLGGKVLSETRKKRDPLRVFCFLSPNGFLLGLDSYFFAQDVGLPLYLVGPLPPPLASLPWVSRDPSLWEREGVFLFFR